MRRIVLLTAVFFLAAAGMVRLFGSPNDPKPTPQNGPEQQCIPAAWAVCLGNTRLEVEDKIDESLFSYGPVYTGAELSAHIFPRKGDWQEVLVFGRETAKVIVVDLGTPIAKQAEFKHYPAGENWEESKDLLRDTQEGKYREVPALVQTHGNATVSYLFDRCGDSDVGTLPEDEWSLRYVVIAETGAEQMLGDYLGNDCKGA